MSRQKTNPHPGRIAVLVTLALLLAGCDTREKARQDTINELLKGCITPARVTVQVGTNEHVRVECEVGAEKLKPGLGNPVAGQ